MKWAVTASMVHVLLCNKTKLKAFLNSDHWFALRSAGFMAHNALNSGCKSPSLAESHAGRSQARFTNLEKQSFKSEVLRGLTSTAGSCSNRGGAEILFFLLWILDSTARFLILGHTALFFTLFSSSVSANTIPPFSLRWDQKRCLPREKLPTRAARARAGGRSSRRRY